MDASTSREIVMLKGDYASILHEDLRIMIKIGPKPEREKRDLSSKKQYRRGLFRFLFATQDDKFGLLLGSIATTVIVGGFILGLARRPFQRPSSLSDIPEEYRLAFISPDHLRNAPEALKEKLHRDNFTTSVLDYYHTLAGILTDNQSKKSKSSFPFTQEMYQNLFSKSRVEKSEIISRQMTADHAQQALRGSAQVVIPAVIGESMTGGMLRIIDKITIMQDGMSLALEKRRAISQVFAKDQEYGFEEYRNVGKDTHSAEFLAKIKPWEKLSDEQMMYDEAESLAKKAVSKQRNLIAFKDPKLALTPESEFPIGLSEGVRSYTFIADFFDQDDDTKMAGIIGSQYGKSLKKEIVKEPLVGVIEPHLVERFIKQNRYQLQLCYEVALRRNEETNGVMEWRWRIDSRGVISDVALVKSNIQDRLFTKCLQEKISRWQFPRPRRGAVEISYPFEFTPNKGRG